MKADKEESKLVLKGILIFIGVIIFFYGCASIGSNSNEDDSKEDRQRWACIMSHDFVEKRLKAPATAEFPACYSTKVIDMGNNDVFRVISYVDSQNSFGAMIRTNYVAELKYLGNEKWRLLDIQFD